MQLPASKPAVYASSAGSHARMVGGMHRKLTAPDLRLVRSMRSQLALLFSLAIVAASPVAAKMVHVAIDWRFDQKSGAWTSGNTGLTLRPKIAEFTQTRAEPVKADGRAGFGYAGRRGVITLYIEHRLAVGYPASGDITPEARRVSLQEMHEAYGKTDSEKSFRLSFRGGGKQGNGVGTICHFLSFPKRGDPPAYSEVGVVLIGDFLFTYRGSFIDKEGVNDLNRFLAALGVKKT